MLLSKMPKHHKNFSVWQRADGEEFATSFLLHESPENYDYWLGYYTVEHSTWGKVSFLFLAPKAIAATVELALALSGAGPLEQVHSNLNAASSGGFPKTLCLATDGWKLI